VGNALCAAAPYRYNRHMAYSRPYLSGDDDELLAMCDIHIYKASGPGGQHRNKVSSAVRLAHRPSGITANGNDSRSQHQNKRLALRRLRMNLACRLRMDFDAKQDALPAVVLECLHKPKKPGNSGAGNRLSIGRKDYRFWHVGAILLDILDAVESRLSDASALLGVSTGNLVRVLKSDRHLLAAAQELRKQHGHSALS
jgi:hypothetical protein